MHRQLIIRVFDYDRVVAHQFMGEVRIDLGLNVFPLKQWFPLKQRGREDEEVSGEVFLKVDIEKTEHEENMAGRRQAILMADTPRLYDFDQAGTPLSDAQLASEKLRLLREHGELR